MTIRVELYDPRHDDRPADYDAFLAAEGLHPFWAYDLLRIASWSSWAPVLLGLVRDGGALAGVVCSMWMMPLRGRYAPASGGPVPRLLDVRQPFNGYGPPWHFAADTAAADRATLMRAFERAALRRLGPACIGIVFRHARVADLPMLRGRRGPIRRPMVSPPGPAVLEGPATYDDWLGSLTQSRRNDLRRQVRRVREMADLTIRFDFGRDDFDAEVAARLVRAQNARLDTGRERRAPPTPTFIRALTARKDVGVLTYTDDTGKMLAFCTLLTTPTTSMLGWWGPRRPEDGGRRHLYFEMYCRLIEWSLDTGRRTINAGRGRLDLKRELGFQAEPMFVVLAPRWIT
jgi:hypothetical protein